MTESLAAMRFLVASDVRVVRDQPDVALATHPAGEYDAFLPLREACRQVTVISRVASLEGTGQFVLGGPLTGEGVDHVGVPDFSSWTGMLGSFPATVWTVWKAVGQRDVVFVRLPEPLSLVVGLVALVRGKPVIANLIANPDSLVVPGPAGLVQMILTGLTGFVVKGAAGVIYVTRSQLQKRFPAPPGVPTLTRSNVQVSNVAAAPRSAPPGKRARLLTVGTNSRLGKGQDLVLEAVSILVALGIDATAVLIGGGDRTAWLQQRAAELDLTDRCEVRGHLSNRSSLIEAYRRADVFCLPSRSEGLPSALVEAMSEGLPAVGSKAGGIPELLPEGQLLDTMSGKALADAVARLLRDPAGYEEASRIALVVAADVGRSTATPVLHGFLQEALERNP